MAPTTAGQQLVFQLKAEEEGYLGSFAYDTVTITVEALTPTQAIAILTGDVQALVPGSLTAGLGNALTSKLDVATAKLAQGKTQTAINQLQAFINQVNAFLNSGVLTSSEGQTLLDAANAIINQLSQ